MQGVLFANVKKICRKKDLEGKKHKIGKLNLRKHSTVFIFSASLESRMLGRIF